MDSHITNEKPSIENNWDKLDDLCPACGALVKKQPGFTKQHLKQLLSFNLKKDWVETILIIGIIVLALLYRSDMAAYNDFMDHKTTYCTQLLSNIEEDKSNNNEIGLMDGLGINISNTSPWTT